MTLMIFITSACQNQDKNVKKNMKLKEKNATSYPLPIKANCYKVYPDKPIKSYISHSNYTGMVFLCASVDTTNLKLENYRITFAKLYSKINSIDTIEIRLFSEKIGNYQFVEKLKPKLVNHLSYIKIIRTNEKNCEVGEFSFPIKIE